MEELGNYQIRIVIRKPFCEQETGCTEGIRTCMSFLTTGRSRHFTEHQSIMKSDNLKMISWSVADPLFLRHSFHSTEGDTNLILGARCNYFNTFFILYVSNKVLKLLKNVSQQWQSGF